MSSLKLFEKIHSIGIVHGDVHRGNIAFREINEQEKLNEELVRLASGDATVLPELVLIDFGQSVIDSITPKQSFKKPNLKDRKSLTILSPDQLDSRAPKPRDDMYRLFELYIDMITDGIVTALLTKAALSVTPSDENSLNPLKWLKANFDFVRGWCDEHEPDADWLPPALVDRLRNYSGVAANEEILSHLESIQRLDRSEDPKDAEILKIAIRIL